MKIFHIHETSLFHADELPDRQVLAIGEFDGLHLGHQRVIGRAIQRANALNLPVAIMTFDPHPREVLGQSRYTSLITPLQERLKLLADMGVDYAYVVRFDLAFSQISPADFVRDILAAMKIHTVVVGFDFRFGHKGQGNPDTLFELAQGHFTVEVIRAFEIEGQKVSSTLIRDCLLSGELNRANQMLGRNYRIKGTVVQGEGRGKSLGFPTANIAPSESYVIPRTGVYAVRVHYAGNRYGGIMNIGTKPTFADLKEPVLEAHIFDFSRSIYGELVEAELLAYIRPEQKFAGADQLVEQIGKDLFLCKQILSENADL